MKASELRIGNLVLIENEVHKLRIRDIYHIEHSSLKVEPVPLTEEWLVKFGFKKQPNLFYDNEVEYAKQWENHEVVIGHNMELYNGIFSRIIKHVHELQNIYFALTGEELTHD